MKYRHEKLAEPLIKELCSKEEGIMYAEKALTKVDRDYAKAIRKMNIIKNEYEREVRLEAIRKEIRNEAILEIARKIKKAGRPVDEIAEFTDLPVETIENL